MHKPAQFPTVLSASNSEFLESLYEQYEADREAVAAEWRVFFDAVANGHLTEETGGSSRARPGVQTGGGNGSGSASSTGVSAGVNAGNSTDDNLGDSPGDSLSDSPGYSGGALLSGTEVLAENAALFGDRGRQSNVFQLINNYRVFGHTRAKLDPLGRPHLTHPPDLSLPYFGLSEAELDEPFSTGTLVAPPVQTLREIIDQVSRTYCGSIGVEYMFIRDQAQRKFLQEIIEQTWNEPHFDRETRLATLTTLTQAELFEKFLHTKFVGQKRFSLEGAETLIPMLNGLVEEAPELGVEEIVMGMPHRGRLNVLLNVMQKAPEFIFSEFDDAGEINPIDGSGDVKYHLGYSQDVRTRGGKKIHLSLTFNPSHLEAVNPVVEGNVRAKQDRRGDHSRTRVLPVLMHGDAAFAGQGMVAETLNLSQLEGYKTGGTIHIIVNNQIGFTTHPRFSRSFLYPSDMAKMLLVPVFHVNGDDPDAALHTMKLALHFRQQFHTDIVIDLMCYRRHGHNEMDEPAFTQPLTYKLIQKHSSTLQIYSQRLEAEGAFTKEEIRVVYDGFRRTLDDALAKAREKKITTTKDTLRGAWTGLERTNAELVVTEVNREVLQEIADDLTSYPPGFTPHRRVVKLLRTRAEMVPGKTPIDWGFGELLAYGTLLRDGFNVRLSGQDVTRGTFSHRHANLVDIETGRDHIALQHLRTQQGLFYIYDSPLSEMGVLGFDFGYSLADPAALTLWEAQFGDFANGAQVVIDQFIAASEAKWLRMSGIVLLLPHGYEGQGPEHSSARLERYLQLCAEDNLQVCSTTTPAQHFHLLRGQMHRKFRKPLIVMAPKSLLRHPMATSNSEDLIKGEFREVLFEKDDLPAQQVRRICLCAGKIYYDLLTERRKREQKDVALVRVERLYPFPAEQVEEMLARFGNAKELCWVQEEPWNMGAWQFIRPHLESVLPQQAALRYIGRPAGASPAVGSHHAHAEEQQALVAQALA